MVHHIVIQIHKEAYMAEVTYASNGKGNLGVTLGSIGTALGVFGNGLGNLFGGMGMGNNANVRWVSQAEFEQGQRIASLESENALLKAERNTDAKMTDVYERLDSKIRTLEGVVNTFKAEQGVINAQVISNISVMQNQIAVLNGLTKTVIPITNVCPEPMQRYNNFVVPSSGTTATAAPAAAAA